jgi:hypothetical protein
VTWESQNRKANAMNEFIIVRLSDRGDNNAVHKAVNAKCD